MAREERLNKKAGGISPASLFSFCTALLVLYYIRLTAQFNYKE